MKIKMEQEALASAMLIAGVGGKVTISTMGVARAMNSRMAILVSSVSAKLSDTVTLMFGSCPVRNYSHAIIDTSKEIVTYYGHDGVRSGVGLVEVDAEGDEVETIGVVVATQKAKAMSSVPINTRDFLTMRRVATLFEDKATGFSDVTMTMHGENRPISINLVKGEVRATLYLMGNKK